METIIEGLGFQGFWRLGLRMSFFAWSGLGFGV